MQRLPQGSPRVTPPGLSAPGRLSFVRFHCFHHVHAADLTCHEAVAEKREADGDQESKQIAAQVDGTTEHDLIDLDRADDEGMQPDPNVQRWWQRCYTVFFLMGGERCCSLSF